MDTIPIAGSRTSSLQSSVSRLNPSCRNAFLPVSGLLSATISSTGLSLSGNTPAAARYASPWALPMKPVPMMPTPISFTPLDLYGPARRHRLDRRIGKPQRFAAIPHRHRHGRSLLHRLGEKVELDPVGVDVALQEEIEDRILHLGFMRRIAPHRGRPQIGVLQHAVGAE